MGKLRGLGIYLIFISIFLVATAYNCLGVGNTSVGCSEKERLALLKFKHSVEDESGMLSSWVGNDCCRWEKIKCDALSGKVESLRLRGYPPNLNNEGQYLFGDEVNSSLAELRHLKYLDLSGNYFGGSRIPEFIGSLKKLRYLNLSNAHFRGVVPARIGNLSNLRVLDLSSHSGLMIDDVSWTFGLSSLEHLDLSSFDLGGTKNRDMVFYMIPSLEYLSLSSCQLSNADIRPFRNSTAILPKIKHLDLGFNFFKGPLPPFLHNMSSLEFLDLSNFNISLAWNFAKLLNMIPSLSELYLSTCELDKIFLSSPFLNISKLSNIQHLDLSHNLIEGIFPFVLTNMSSLRVLDLSRNRLNSSVPVIPSLLELDLSFNKFTQIEHVGIWRQCYLKELSASYNNFGIEMTESPKNVSECSQYALERLDLHESMYAGTFPESLGRLGNLRGMDLSWNELTGPIPESIGRLRLLEVLDLSNNQITSPIPTFIGKLSKLDLSSNQLNGSIPESFGKLAALTDLNLQFNRLTGPIPTFIGRLSSLKSISVRSNLLNGTIPVSIGHLAKLHFVDIANNSFEGVVSETHLSNLSALKDLDTSFNTKLAFNVSHEWVPPFQLVNLRIISCHIKNGFPKWLQNQRKLVRLDLSNATISGPLPKWLQNMNMLFLDLSHNQLSGSLTNLPNRGDVGGLFMENNLFNESIPTSLCKLSNLQYLDLSRNRLTGEIPKCLGNLRTLSTMRFSSNRLSGVIPSSIALTSLAQLNLNDNNLIGELPRELENLRDLNVLDLGDNKFSGNIPKWIGENLTYLKVLRLHGNNFTGRIPQSLCKASHLRILDIAYNNLTGSIPRCLGELNAMFEPIQLPHYYGTQAYDENVKQAMKGVDIEYTKTWELVYNMDLSSNKLVGEIPVELAGLCTLMGLNLSNNHLDGGIPNNIGNMSQLFSLDLSTNKLTGTIPQSMAALNFLSHLNLSHNNFSGRIPTGSQLQTLTDPWIYAGNEYLCGPPLPKNCSNHEDQTTMPKKNYEASVKSENVWLFYLDIVCGFATGFWGIIGVLLFKKRWRVKLFMFVEETMDKIYVAVVVRVAKIKRGLGAT